MSKKNDIFTAALAIMNLYKQHNDPKDIWHNLQIKQGYRDCLEIFKKYGLIKDYDLEKYTISPAN